MVYAALATLVVKELFSLLKWALKDRVREPGDRQALNGIFANTDHNDLHKLQNDVATLLQLAEHMKEAVAERREDIQQLREQMARIERELAHLFARVQDRFRSDGL